MSLLFEGLFEKQKIKRAGWRLVGVGRAGCAGCSRAAMETLLPGHRRCCAVRAGGRDGSTPAGLRLWRLCRECRDTLPVGVHQAAPLAAGPRCGHAGLVRPLWVTTREEEEPREERVFVHIQGVKRLHNRITFGTAEIYWLSNKKIAVSARRNEPRLCDTPGQLLLVGGTSLEGSRWGGCGCCSREETWSL